MLYFWLPLIALGAATFSTVAGFGAGIILITFASLAMDIKTVVPISTLFFFGLSATQMYIFRRSIDWKTILIFCCAALPGIGLGMALFHILPGAVLKRIIAVVVLGYCANSLLRLVPERTPSTRVTAIISLVTGLIDAITASGGTIQAPLFLARGLRKETFVASFAASSVLLNPIKVGIYWSLGYFDVSNLWLVGMLVVAGFLGVQIGRQILTRISSDTFQKLAVGFLMVLGLKLLVFG